MRSSPPDPVASVAAVVAAAGSGARLGRSTPKALSHLAGEPLLLHAVRTIGRVGVDRIVVAAPPEMVTACSALLAPVTGDIELSVVAGRASRRLSVAACLRELGDTELVLVHDAARPLVPLTVFGRVLAALHAGADAVVPAIPVTDTIKEVKAARVLRTLERGALYAVQTPQGFTRDVLVAAHAAAVDAVDATDDAALVEALGVYVSVVEGAAEGFKITGPVDLQLAELVLANRGS